MIFDRAIKTATRLVAKYGQAVTWRQIGISENTSQPWKATDVPPVDTPVKIVFLSPRSNDFKEMIALMQGTDVVSGGTRGLLAPTMMEDGITQLAPTINDEVIRGGLALSIENINTVAPNGIPILFVIEFKL